MKLTHETYDQLAVVALKGDLTEEHTKAFQQRAGDCMQGGVRDFVLDLREAEFVDSRGLESLLWLQEQCGERLGQVRLAGARDNLKTILRMTRLATRFDAHDDVDSAVRSLRI